MKTFDPFSDTETLETKSCQKQKINAWLRWSERGELKNLSRTYLASLKAEKKSFDCFWQHIDSRDSVSEQKKEKVRIPGPQCS